MADAPAAEETVTLPRYPVYVLSKDRYQLDRALTAKTLARDGVPFHLAVESHQVDDYRRLCDQIAVDPASVLDIGFRDLGMGCSSVRNWITDHSRANGDARQWQLDDNSRMFYRTYKARRIPCRAGLALRVIEDFSDRYENVGLAGPNYHMFGMDTTKPFVSNCHVYSCTLVNNAIDCRWRGPYNEDTDMCLQVLAGGWCTVLVNAFLIDKMKSFAAGPKRQTEGGMSELYANDGRLKMARSLERWWPGIVTTDRRFQRPQHRVHSEWRKFDTPLRLRPGVDLSALPPVDNYGMTLTKLKEPKSERIRALADEYEGD